MSRVSPDKTLDAIAESMQALGVEGLLTDSFESQIDEVVKTLLSSFRAKTLTNEELWAAIGAIDRLDHMRHRLDRAIRNGQRISQQLMENSDARV